MKKILAICGSTREKSTNLHILDILSRMSQDIFEVEIFDGLGELPHFNPDIDKIEPPKVIQEIRKKIQNADGVIICTPEYVFSIPGSLKNLLEWCVSTTIFKNKPLAIITAAASGEKGHEELLLIMKTLESKYTENTSLFISGVRGKVQPNGVINDVNLLNQLEFCINSLNTILF